MSRVCHFCGKKAMTGNTVSHSNNKTRRTFDPNLQRVTVEESGQSKKVYACTKCIKAGKTLTV